MMPAPQLKKIPSTELPDDIRSAWEKSMELRGDATFFEVFGNHPDLYHWYTERFYKELFYAKRLDKSLKELLRIRMSTVHGCKFCNQGNRLAALEAGLSQAQIAGLQDYESGPFSASEKAVLRLADEMVLSNPNGSLGKKLYKELRNHFSDAEILELGMIMGILAGMAKFIFVFDLVEKEENCPFNPKK